MFSSSDAFQCTIWKYVIANRFDYYFVDNYHQQIAMRCTTKGRDSTCEGSLKNGWDDCEGLQRGACEYHKSTMSDR